MHSLQYTAIHGSIIVHEVIRRKRNAEVMKICSVIVVQYFEAKEKTEAFPIKREGMRIKMCPIITKSCKFTHYKSHNAVRKMPMLGYLHPHIWPSLITIQSGEKWSSIYIDSLSG